MYNNFKRKQYNLIAECSLKGVIACFVTKKIDQLFSTIGKMFKISLCNP